MVFQRNREMVGVAMKGGAIFAHIPVYYVYKY